MEGAVGGSTATTMSPARSQISVFIGNRHTVRVAQVV